MQTKEITIRVASEAADIYQTSTREKKRKFDALLSTWLTNAEKSSRSLKEIRQEASEQAQDHGLTPEILNNILDE